MLGIFWFMGAEMHKSFEDYFKKQFGTTNRPEQGQPELNNMNTETFAGRAPFGEMITLKGEGGNMLSLDDGFKYIGTKQMHAYLMNLGDYNAFRGWTIPENEDPNREGYIVREDGYISWSPKEIFEASYRRTNGMNFGLALELVKQGKKVCRTGWNGKGMFIFMRPADELDVEMIVHKVKSLPNSVKDYFAAKTNPDRTNGRELDGSSLITFTAYLCMKAADGSIVNGWLASQTDMLSDDWMIVE